MSAAVAGSIPRPVRPWSLGFSIPAVDFNGSAQTGYDTSAEVDFVFNANRQICGTNDIPASAGQFVAKP
jgi:hypothetical protein